MSKKISELTAAGALTGMEQVEIVQSSASRRTTTQDIANLASGGISGLTTNRIPKAASGTTLNDSELYQASTSIGLGTTSPGRKFHVEQDSAATNTVTYVQRLTSTSSGTPAVGIGVGMEFEAETAAGNNEVGASLEVSASNVGSGTEDFNFAIKQMRNGAAPIETLRIEPTTSNTVVYRLGSGFSGTGRGFVADSSGADAEITLTAKGAGGISLSNGAASATLTVNANTAATVNDAVNNAVTNALNVTHTTSGSAANGIGTGIALITETTGNTTGSRIASVSTDVTNGSQDFDLVIETMAGGAAASEALRIKSDKSTVFTGPAVLPSFTVAGVPAAASYTGGMIYVSNETGGAVPAFSDGTNWRRVTDRAIIS